MQLLQTDLKEYRDTLKVVNILCLIAIPFLAPIAFPLFGSFYMQDYEIALMDQIVDCVIKGYFVIIVIGNVGFWVSLKRRHYPLMTIFTLITIASPIIIFGYRFS